MHGPIHNHLLSGCLDMLVKLGQEVLEKREEAMPVFGLVSLAHFARILLMIPLVPRRERAFRIPVRVTYNDTKRLHFLSDLANPAVPLSRLMRNPVPHGFKGLELFDTMFSPISVAGHNRTPSGGTRVQVDPIPIDRAIWFIRVLGSNEITAHRSRAQPTAPVSAPSPAAATPSSTNTVTANPVLPMSSNDWYTQEFTSMFTSWLRVQLGQLSLPVKAGKAGILPSKAVPGILGDDKARARWLAKWDYRCVFNCRYKLTDQYEAFARPSHPTSRFVSTSLRMAHRYACVGQSCSTWFRYSDDRRVSSRHGQICLARKTLY